MHTVGIKFFEKRYRNRNYLHFDRKLHPSLVHTYVTVPSNIAHHSFYPFISYNLSDKKIHRVNGQVTYNCKSRNISYPSHIDSDIYAYYSKLLEIHYESYLLKNNLENCVIAYRKVEIISNGKKVSQCNIHFSKAVFDFIRLKRNCVVLCYDIEKFFDNLDHKILKNNWRGLIGKNLDADHYAVYKSLTSFASVDKVSVYNELGFSLKSRTLNKRYKRLCDAKDFRDRIRGKGLVIKNKSGKGIPQGSPISGLLSNIYMMDFDAAAQKFFEDIDGRYHRYCDDMIFVFDISYEQQVTKFVAAEILKLKLNINSKKTQRIEFKNGLVHIDPKNTSYNHPDKLQYLGLLFDGNQIFLRETGLTKYHRKLRKAIRMRVGHYRKLKKNNNHNGNNIYMRTMNTRFTYIGKRNYIGYAFRVANIHDSKKVKRQVKGHYKLFNEYLNKKM